VAGLANNSRWELRLKRCFFEKALGVSVNSLLPRICPARVVKTEIYPVFTARLQWCRGVFFQRRPLQGAQGRCLQGLLGQQDLRNDACGNGYQHVVPAGLHPLVAARRRTQMMAAPVLHHILPIAVLLGQAAAPVKIAI
jgi:hypothetical protein